MRVTRHKAPFKTDYAVHPITAQIINRDCHVSWSNRQVIKYVISRMKYQWTSFAKMSRHDRREFMRQCVNQHSSNRHLYGMVMGPSR